MILFRFRLSNRTLFGELMLFLKQNLSNKFIRSFSIKIITLIISTLDRCKIFFLITYLITFYDYFLKKNHNGFYQKSNENIKKTKLSDSIFNPKLFVKNTLKQRDYNIYELDTSLLIHFIPLYKFEIVLEIGAAYGYFTSKICEKIFYKKNKKNTKVLSIEPDKNYFENYLLPLKDKYNDNLILLNDFAGDKASVESKIVIEDFYKDSSDNSGFLFIDADLYGISVIELLNNIINSLNLDKFNMILLELSNNPYYERRNLAKGILKDFLPLRISKKRYLFIRKS